MNSAALASYPPGLASSLPTPVDANLAAMITGSCHRYADAIALVQDDTQLSYAELGRLSDRFAAWLSAEQGLEAGARVALMMPNILSFPVAICGVLKAGCVLVNVNPLYTARELEHQLNDSMAELLVVAAPFVSTALEATTNSCVRQLLVAPMTGHPSEASEVAEAGMLSFAHALACDRVFVGVDRHLHDSAVLQYTGGTTGPSKGADLSHSNLLSNLDQFGNWMHAVMQPEREVVLTALPLYHIFALMVNFLTFLRLGGRNVLISNPRDLPAMVATMRREGCSALTGVNTLFNGLLNCTGFEQQDFSQLRLTMAGGAAIQPAIAKRWQQVTGRSIIEGYGLSETSPVLTVNRVDTGSFRPGIGLPLPSTEISIRDESGTEVMQGEEGELCAKGPQVMKGYWNQPEVNARAFTTDGYFRTGDIARQDDAGYYHIVDRKKDMVLVSGFNVYPNEVEAMCAEHKGVLECACIGVPDDKTGEAIKLFVVRRSDLLTAAQLVEHCRNGLAAYKVPKQVVFVEQLPKSPVGKILRRELRTCH